MIKVDLIAGFLGAGKTTFLLKYAKWLMEQGMRIGILVYDYGSVNVDMLLLNGLRGDKCELEMVAAGCDTDCLNRRFKTKLISMALSGYDRVIIEPSGVFDMDMFFDALRDAPLENWYEIGSVLTVVNAKLTDHMTVDEEFILASQAASSGRILYSRMQLASKEELEATKAHIQKAAESIHAKVDLESGMEKDWDCLEDADYKELMNAGYHIGDYVKMTAGRDADFSSKCYLEHTLLKEQVLEIVKLLFASEKYGKIIRVKGFVVGKDASYQINASQYECMLEQVEKGQNALIVIGTDLQEKELDRLFLGIDN